MTDYVIYNGELYHYGVPGMKWGVRRDRQYNNWKNKQHARMDKLTEKDIKRIDKKISKTKESYKAIGNPEYLKNQQKTLSGKKTTSKILNKKGHEAINSITKKQYNKILIRQTGLTAAGAVSMGLAIGGVLPIGVLHIPSTNLNLNKYRVK